MHRYDNAPDLEEFTEQDLREREIQRKKDRIGWIIRGLLVLLVVITFGSCGSRLAYRASAPGKTLAGEAWREDWITVGKKLGIDTAALPEGWSLDYNQEVSLSDKVYMALLGYGPGETVTYQDRDGKTAERMRYSAGFYIMARGSGSEAACDADHEQWKSVQQGGCDEWEPVTILSETGRTGPESEGGGSEAAETAGASEEPVTYEVYRYTYRPGSSEDYDRGFMACARSRGWAYAFQMDWNSEAGWTEEEAEEQLTRLLGALVYAQ